MRKNMIPLGMMAVAIFGLGLETGVVMTKYVMKKRGVIL